MIVLGFSCALGDEDHASNKTSTPHSNSFGMFETAVSAFVDEFPDLLKKRKVIFTAFLCCILFVLGLPCVTEGGMYVLKLMDWYSATFSLMIISLFETIAIGWVYGVDRFMYDISLMTKRKPSYWWKLCWCYITPGTIILLLIFIISDLQPVKYNNYTYPQWSVALGWIMAMCSIIPIPILAVIQLYKAEGSLKERLISCLRPSPDWGPALEENRIQYKKSLSIVSSRFGHLNDSSVNNSPSEERNMDADLTTIPLQSESIV